MPNKRESLVAKGKKHANNARPVGRNTSLVHAPQTTAADDDLGNDAGGDGLHYYKLGLPSGIYAKLRSAAKARHTTVLDLMRRFITFGLLALELQDTGTGSVVIRKGETEETLYLW